MTNLNKKKALLVGTGESIWNYADQLKKAHDLNIPIFTYSNSILFCLLVLKIEPTYWTWVDPASVEMALKVFRSPLKYGLVKKPSTKPIILRPLNEIDNEEEFALYLGSTGVSRKDPDAFKKYKKDIEYLKGNYGCILGQATTIKNINLQKEKNPLNIPFCDKDLDYKDFGRRFYNDVCVIGSCLSGYDSDIVKPRIANGHMLTENKLTAAALPVVQKFPFDEIYLVGWDGIGRRWRYNDSLPPPLHNPLSQEMGHSSLLTYRNLKYWNDRESITSMKIYSLMTDEESIINQYVHTKDFNTFLAEYEV